MREFGKFELWNLESRILESEMQLKEFEIPLTIGIRNPKCGVHYRNPWHGTRIQDFAPCKGIQDSLGFWIPCCGFRIPGTGFRIPAQWIPDSKNSWITFFFRFEMLFFALRFRVRILLYWKTLLEGITSLFSLSIYKVTERNVLQFRKGLWYNNEGDIGGLSTPQHRRKK